MTLRTTLAAAALLISTGAAQAQVLQERNISLTAAQAIALGAVEACAARNMNVTATVVDRAGIVRASLRADRAGPHTVESSVRKAFTSVSMRSPTSTLQQATIDNPGARNLVDLPGVLLLGGGVPVRAGDEVIGAVGVGGAPSGQIDEECANAGLQRAQDRLR
ncbi:heme-binding protein [Roseomonas sp. CAU 1739]|uniref:GlcG/HbpS family heme-binding protein n=1 Tax=Roseomonas sp. CAU 1739 TaxID=3140364 RepID=UPI00325C3144